MRIYGRAFQGVGGGKKGFLFITVSFPTRTPMPHCLAMYGGALVLSRALTLGKREKGFFFYITRPFVITPSFAKVDIYKHYIIFRRKILCGGG